MSHGCGFALAQPVHIKDGHQVVQLVVPGKVHCLPDGALCRFTISNDTVHTVALKSNEMSIRKPQDISWSSLSWFMENQIFMTHHPSDIAFFHFLASASSPQPPETPFPLSFRPPCPPPSSNKTAHQIVSKVSTTATVSFFLRIWLVGQPSLWKTRKMWLFDSHYNQHIHSVIIVVI